MDTLFENKKEEKRGVNKVLLAALAVAALLVAGGLWLLTLQPSIEEQKQQELEGAYLESSPEFEQYTKNLIINTDTERTTESLIGLGTIAMMLHADIRNRGDKTINGLEVKVGVIDRLNNVLKEKNVMVVPKQTKKLNPNETIHIAVPMDGFKQDADRANIRWKVTAIRFE
ncbi:MAG: hypothetical protein M3Q78_03775 [Acidobacteriota bacterium]|nr:hypothetical protein [Acidobacteriota bacterium]